MPKSEQQKQLEKSREEIIKDAQKQYEKWEKDFPHMTEKRMLYDISQALAFQQNLLTVMYNFLKQQSDELQNRQTEV